FTRPQTVEVVLDSLRFLQEQRGLRLYAYVVLENHLHFVAQSEDLSRDVGDFKSYTARRLVDFFVEQRVERVLQQLAFFKKQHKLGQMYQVWEEGSHPQLLQNQEMMLQKVQYIHENPVKRGYVDLPEHWRYSSARNYLGLEGLLDVYRDWGWLYSISSPSDSLPTPTRALLSSPRSASLPLS
ncbi:MAG: hypothetical protein AAGJ35_08565, partial [Myxococcota bacterium]